MPTLNKVYTLTITPEQFIEACSDVELQELQILLNSYRCHKQAEAKCYIELDDNSTDDEPSIENNYQL